MKSFTHIPFSFCFRFCVCMLHEIFTRWLVTLHKIILAHHDEDCDCNCSFCITCGDFETLSIGKFMRMMLCPPALRFHGSSTPLFVWDCTEDKFSVRLCNTMLKYYKLSFPFFPAVTCVTPTNWRVSLSVRFHVYCMTRGKLSTGCMNQ